MSFHTLASVASRSMPPPTMAAESTSKEIVPPSILSSTVSHMNQGTMVKIDGNRGLMVGFGFNPHPSTSCDNLIDMQCSTRSALNQHPRMLTTPTTAHKIAVVTLQHPFITIFTVGKLL
eukprot:m.275365 g.275365  ORF g.275365 m.275365 type:complete len:119 (-) comp118237_c0_seq1:61-417(-)